VSRGGRLREKNMPQLSLPAKPSEWSAGRKKEKGSQNIHDEPANKKMSKKRAWGNKDWHRKGKKGAQETTRGAASQIVHSLWEPGVRGG